MILFHYKELERAQEGEEQGELIWPNSLAMKYRNVTCIQALWKSTGGVFAPADFLVFRSRILRRRLHRSAIVWNVAGRPWLLEEEDELVVGFGGLGSMGLLSYGRV